MTDIQPIDDQARWDEQVKRFDGHPLQLWGWGEVKARHGWQADRVLIGQGGAQLLIKRLPKPFGPLVYVPRGPFGSLLRDDMARQTFVDYVKQTYKPLVLTVEPDTTGEVTWKGWQKSNNRILLARTAVMDLTKPDEALLAVMSKKTRQYIRKSAGEGIVVTEAQTAADIDDCLVLYKQTAERAGFSLHDKQYYHDIFSLLGSDSPVYMAKKDGQTVAFLWPIITPEVAFELYGGMNDEGQRLRANYHLKWSVIQAMKQRGVKRYDVNGLLNDGVSAFKQGFIPEETQMSGTFDMPLSPLYPVWSSMLPAVKRIVQRVRG
ncbi:MAG TPA: peptidoglycan bridge formation glycyltransferase FemA/FemB family protein [Candidatus Saccharibacteria bacterium]|nr:peptidoglycan bridge formation glycyltransferase FemA/FemB family protein [Candidatus Saccharibacteria bacterium]HRK94027.1 peptidoglycan bridge formation glycyltransferase FemA/FemB family protein [Candidatus Saccharibacteria bacterium]